MGKGKTGLPDNCGMITLTEAQERLGYMFRRPALLKEALTHKSHAKDQQEEGFKDNERLEFLGDAVVGLVVSDFLASTYPNFSEGELSKIKARLVSRTSLAQVAQRQQLGDLLRLGRGEEVTDGRVKPSLLGNALEAVVGAIYLDGGFETVQTYVLRILQGEIRNLQDTTLTDYVGDFKSRLQEYCQKQFDTLPTYEVIRESGPDHQKVFEVQVGFQGKMWGKGVGKSKKEAEQVAAQQALVNLRKDADL